MYNQRIEELANEASKVDLSTIDKTKNYLVFTGFNTEYRSHRISEFSDSFYLPTIVDEDSLEGYIQSEKERLYDLLQEYWDIYDNIKVPTNLLPYIINGELEGVTEEEVEKWDKLIHCITAGKVYTVEYDPSTYFSWSNDITSCGDNVYDITVYVSKE